MIKRLFISLTIIAAAACNGSANSKLTPVQFADSMSELERALTPKDRPMVINHWATWCGPCVDELPYISQIAAKYAGKVDFVTVAWEQSRDGKIPDGKTKDKITSAVDRVRERTGVSFTTIVPLVSWDEMAVKLALLGQTVPQTFVVTKGGKRAWSLNEEIQSVEDKSAFEKAIEDALR